METRRAATPTFVFIDKRPILGDREGGGRVRVWFWFKKQNVVILSSDIAGNNDLKRIVRLEQKAPSGQQMIVGH